MTGRRCEHGGYLPAQVSQLPSCACERGLFGLMVGCNRMRCAACGQLAVLQAGVFRCACREAYPTGVWLERQPNGPLDPPSVPWLCDGHPAATAADLTAMGFTGELLADVEAALTTLPEPPHAPDGQHGYLVEVRLDLAPSYDEAAVRALLVAAVDGDDDRATQRALKVLSRHDWVPLEGAVFRWRQLAQRKDPSDSFFDLGFTWQNLIADRAKRDGPGSVAMREARQMYDAAPDKATRWLKKLFRT